MNNSNMNNSNINNSNLNNPELFIEKYKYLERVTSEKYNLTKYDSPIAYLEKLTEYANIKEELHYCRDVRNFLQHENKIDNDFVIIPSDKMIKLIDKVINLVEKPPLCKDIAIKIENIYYKKLNDYVISSMIAMKHRKFTHIPLLNDEGVVVGVFSKSSVFSYLLDNEDGKISTKLKFSDMKKYLNTSGDESEKYSFVPFDSTISSVSQLFENGYKRAIKIAMIFLTSDGTSNGKLLGIITPYDLIRF